MGLIYPDPTSVDYGTVTANVEYVEEIELQLPVGSLTVEAITVPTGYLIKVGVGGSYVSVTTPFALVGTESIFLKLTPTAYNIDYDFTLTIDDDTFPTPTLIPITVDNVRAFGSTELIDDHSDQAVLRLLNQDRG